MTHTPVVINTKIEYYDFEMNGMDGPQQYPTVGLPTYSGEKIKERIAQMSDYYFCIKSVTPIHQGVLDYMGDNMSVGGTSPTCGIVVIWEQTCCAVRKAFEKIMMREENRKKPEKWLNWADAHRACGNLKHSTAILKIAQSRFQDEAQIFYFSACLSCFQDDFISAKDYLKKAIEMDNKYEEMSKIDVDLFPLFILEK